MGTITSFNPSEEWQPHSIEAEQQVLGALLNDNKLFGNVSDILSAESFYDPVHGEIYEQIRTRIDAGHNASPVTIAPPLKSHAGLAELGGVGYLVNLQGYAMSMHAVRDYASIVVDYANRRALMESLRHATARVHDGKDPTNAICQDVETEAGALLSRSTTKPLIRSHLSTLHGALNSINDAYMGIKPPGIGTGLRQLDDKLGFLRAGNMVLVAGRPAMGKTTVAQNLAFAAANAGVGVFFASLEMTGEELSTRFISKGLATRGQHIEYSRMIKGQLTEGEMRHVVEEARRQQVLPIEVAERDVREVSRLRSAARRAQQKMADSQTPLGLVVIDYVQKIEHANARSGYETVSRASDMCKDLAIDLGVPVVPLAQLSRTVEHRDPPVPMLSDLRDTGKLEEDADVVLFCYRESYYLQREIDALQGEDTEKEVDLRYAMDRCRDNIDLIVAKQRSGATGTVRAYIKPGLCHVSQDRAEAAGELI